ncbi:hypothetical protein GCM10027408_23250 [Microbacterium tumbae]
MAQDGVLIPDESAVLPGRGAWVHPTQECLDKAIARRAFARALRVTAMLDTRTIEQYRRGNKG